MLEKFQNEKGRGETIKPTPYTPPEGLMEDKALEMKFQEFLGMKGAEDLGLSFKELKAALGDFNNSRADIIEPTFYAPPGSKKTPDETLKKSEEQKEAEFQTFLAERGIEGLSYKRLKDLLGDFERSQMN